MSDILTCDHETTPQPMSGILTVTVFHDVAHSFTQWWFTNLSKVL